MNWKNKKVLVTGAGGFIGSHLVEELVKMGADVRCFIRYNSRGDWGQIEFLPERIKDHLEIIMGDLKDSDAVRKTAKKCDTIFHLGALIAIPYSYIHPLDFVQTNITGTVNLLNAALENKVEKFIHTSTSEVYGTAQYVPIDEAHPLRGQSPYSASKIGADKMAESYYRAFGLKVAVIRPFNAYGPRQSARAIIPTIITQALTKGMIHLGSLSPKRDFTYVGDTVNGFIKIAESEKSVGEVINIGSGKEISIGELADLIAKLSVRKIKVVFDDKRIRPPKSEVERLLADNNKAHDLINWEPTVSLEEGLKKTISWVRQNIKRYKCDLYNV
ncbi:MAG: GDP-mannose 4,6-dehydratase [Planctomycetes bacterium]|nr:GDP-mannose 4,6-dehydratase [Planctomycetota bacterium]